MSSNQTNNPLKITWGISTHISTSYDAITRPSAIRKQFFLRFSPCVVYGWLYVALGVPAERSVCVDLDLH